MGDDGFDSNGHESILFYENTACVLATRRACEASITPPPAASGGDFEHVARGFVEAHTL